MKEINIPKAKTGFTREICYPSLKVSEQWRKQAWKQGMSMSKWMQMMINRN